MTINELKQEAENQGYRLIKIPNYTCTCYMEYPNKCHKKKNGKWKCLDYEPIKFNHTRGNPITRCRKKGT